MFARYLSFPPIVALVCFSAIGCYRSVDYSKVQCLDDSSCPTSLSHCSRGANEKFGRCIGGVGAGGSSLDAPTATGSGGKGGSLGAGGGGTSLPTDVRPSDAGGSTGDTTTLPDGDAATTQPDVPLEAGGGDPASCKSDSECATGFCVDGVCCDSVCDGQCQSCKEPGSVGKCKAIKGTPLSPRASCGGTAPCAGQCDGSNGKTCAFPDSTTICAAATCATGKVTTASVCNSIGACSTPTTSTCPNSQCAADGSAKCATACTATSCGAGAYCDTTGACLPTLAAGSSCSSGTLCASGYCVDGVCCDGKCDGQCESCKETGSVGKCSAVKGAPLATRTACGGTGACKGQCDGVNGKACTSPDSTVVCAAATCTAGKATTASVCNGSGACTTATTSPCASNLCATDGSGKCSGSCTAASCSAGTYCDSTGTCTKTLDNGASCSAGTQCTSGNCVDGVCCDGACTGQCQSCKETGSVGKCKAVSGAPISPRAACGGTGKCKAQCDGTNGTACAYPDDSTVCTAASCASGKVTTASVCNGSGSCTASTTNACDSNLCAADGVSCAGSCTATSCSAGTYCGSGGACTPTLGDGKVCSGDAQCTHGHCVSGTCCNSACGECHSCSTGACTALNPGTACGSGSGYVCDATGSCVACAAGGSCTSPNECQNYAYSCSTGTKQCVFSSNKGAVSCGPAQSCRSGIKYLQSTCSAGACPAQSTVSCANGCNSTGTDCLTCSGSSVACGGGCCDTTINNCVGTTCTAKPGAGQSCSSTVPCASNLTCSIGICCPSGYTNSSGLCCKLSWDFADNGLNGWTLSGGTADGTISASGQVLVLSGVSFDPDRGSSDLWLVGPPFCGGSSLMVTTLTAKIKFSSSNGHSFGGTGAGAILVQGDNFGNVGYLGGSPLSPQADGTVVLSASLPVRSPGPTYISIRFIPGDVWSGTITLDDITLYP